MKNIYLGFFAMALFFCQNSQAQLTDNSIAPDFTLTDINGTSHNLYNYLDQGKAVILNFGATWNPDTWSYHTSNVLQDVASTYPNDVLVLFIEGDITTGNAELNGTGNSLGDYTDIANFPIIDVAPPPLIIQNYDAFVFPVVYFIGPNRLTKNIGQLPFNSLSSLIENRPPAASGANNVAILQYTGDDIYCAGIEASLGFQNLGSANVNSAVFGVKNENGTEIGTATWTGNLQPYGLAIVNFNNIITDDNSIDWTFQVKQVNNANDADAAFNASSLSVNRSELTTWQGTTSVEITVTTDNLGYETYWALLNDSGTIIEDGGNAAVGLDGGGKRIQTSGGYPANSVNTTTVNLSSDACYKFIIVDDWGDGICCSSGNGSYEVKTANGDILFSGAQFGTIEVNGIEIDFAASVEDLVDVNSFSIFPMPATDNLNVEFELYKNTKAEILITNTLGQVMQQETVNLTNGNNQYKINVSGFANGFYFLSIETKEGTLVRKFNVLK